MTMFVRDDGVPPTRLHGLVRSLTSSCRKRVPAVPVRRLRGPSATPAARDSASLRRENVGYGKAQGDVSAHPRLVFVLTKFPGGESREEG